jgi:Ice-binding-like
MRRLIFKARFLGIGVGIALVGMWPMAAQAAATAPSLGAAASFAVLGASTVTCIGPTVITGDLGLSPGISITGFPVPCTVIGATHIADAIAAQAQIDATTAYNALAKATCPASNNLTGQDLGTLPNPLKPGVYCFDSSAELTGTLNLTGGGIYIFQIGSTLTTASASSVLINNAQPCDASSDVFWQVGSSATLGTTSAFAGNILALASITMNTGASLDGRAIALTAAVTLDSNAITTCGQTGGGGNGHGSKCNQGVGNGPEGCDPGNSNQGNPANSNDELGGTPGNPGRKGGNSKTNISVSSVAIAQSTATGQRATVVATKPQLQRVPVAISRHGLIRP